MNCVNHADRQAVAQCKQCGAYVCEECRQRTQGIAKDYGVLCPDCFRRKFEEIRDYYAGIKSKKIRSATVSLICYIIGIVIMLISLPGIWGTIKVLIGLLLMGGYCAVASWRFASNSIDEYDMKHGATYVITDTGISRDKSTWLKVVFFILGLVFGIFITPVNIIRWYIQAAVNKKRVADCEEVIASV